MNEENRRGQQRWSPSAMPAGFAVTDARHGVLSGRIDPAVITDLGPFEAQRKPVEEPEVPQARRKPPKHGEPEIRREPPRHSEPEFMPEEPEASPELVRPYFRTKGRTRPGLELSIEALISTSHKGLDTASLRVPEHRSICELCVDTRSVAEVAACLRLPLGVARVLIGDVVALELVMVHSAEHMAGDRPSIEFMERVLIGLRTV